MNIDHDQANSKFFTRLGDDEARLTYSKEGKVLNFLSVFVPEAFRGQGVAVKLGNAAFEYAQNGGFKVIPTCPFIANQYLARHPEYRSLIVS